MFKLAEVTKAVHPDTYRFTNIFRKSTEGLIKLFQTEFFFAYRLNDIEHRTGKYISFSFGYCIFRGIVENVMLCKCSSS